MFILFLVLGVKPKDVDILFLIYFCIIYVAHTLYAVYSLTLVQYGDNFLWSLFIYTFLCGKKVEHLEENEKNIQGN